MKQGRWSEHRITLGLSIAIVVATLTFIAAPLVNAHFPVEKWLNILTQKLPVQQMLQQVQNVRSHPNLPVLLSAPTPLPTPLPLSHSELSQMVQTIRTENELPPLTADPQLNDYSRLLSLESEDQQSLKLANSRQLLRAVMTTPPSRVEVLLLFSADGNREMFFSQLASQSALLDKTLTRWGLATRSATLQEQDGTIIAIALAPKVTAVAAPTPVPTATFTGQDLWAAVNEYRRAHSLPLFSSLHEEHQAIQVLHFCPHLCILAGHEPFISLHRLSLIFGICSQFEWHGLVVLSVSSSKTRTGKAANE